MRRPAVAGRRVYREVVWLFPLWREIHSHSVGAGLGASFTHLIREASLAGGAGRIIIKSVIRRCRDQTRSLLAPCRRRRPAEMRRRWAPARPPMLRCG